MLLFLGEQLPIELIEDPSVYGHVAAFELHYRMEG